MRQAGCADVDGACGCQPSDIRITDGRDERRVSAGFAGEKPELFPADGNFAVLECAHKQEPSHNLHFAATKDGLSMAQAPMWNVYVSNGLLVSLWLTVLTFTTKS